MDHKLFIYNPFINDKYKINVIKLIIKINLVILLKQVKTVCFFHITVS